MQPIPCLAIAAILLAAPVCGAAELGGACTPQTKLTRNMVCKDGEVSRDFEEGEACTADQKLPTGVYCHQGEPGEFELVDCRAESGSFGHVTSLLCASYEGERLRNQLNSTYQELLAILKSGKPEHGKRKPSREFADLRNELVKSQQSWEQFVSADCRMDEQLVTGGGNMNGAVGMDCHNAHVESRLARLKALRESIQTAQD